ncbi:hypothetical protein COEREDRAFT_11131 [Coemansia reversa NRRL 1564]|uniref:Uncharacterized protein n=1 Tax=Coemansia reversa (strain ATCC 12441 / NRRL 1564) TaxID=763665 RepID=A0A2G5B4T6_COERN|nr:hypothetical protein COEREDRAFT_11131 [Coemansia reversa NRRL 1564]|eukprot:PIA13727.1 hypothetical protein COEREDRAFT_11131 [Coemansia reversa NRRL 1564]
MTTPSSSVNTPGRQHWQRESVEELLEWLSYGDNVNKYFHRLPYITIGQHYTTLYNDIAQAKPRLATFRPQLIWKMAQKLLSVYNRLYLLKNLGNTLDREVKISARIYIPWETLEAAFKEYNIPVSPQTTFADDTAQSQDLESDFETSIITDVVIPSLISATTTSPFRMSHYADHQQRCRTILYGLLFKLMEHDISRTKAAEPRFEVEKHRRELKKIRREFEQCTRELEEDRREEEKRRREEKERRKKELHELKVAKARLELRLLENSLLQNNTPQLNNIPGQAVNNP